MRTRFVNGVQGLASIMVTTFVPPSRHRKRTTEQNLICICWTARTGILLHTKITNYSPCQSSIDRETNTRRAKTEMPRLNHSQWSQSKVPQHYYRSIRRADGTLTTWCAYMALCITIKSIKSPHGEGVLVSVFCWQRCCRDFQLPLPFVRAFSCRLPTLLCAQH